MKTKNLVKDEFIGKYVKIMYNNQQFEGKIINETKNMIYIKTNTNNKKIIKKNMKIIIDNQKIEGESIRKRPEERIKLR